jgi:hypothetical protein
MTNLLTQPIPVTEEQARAITLKPHSSFRMVLWLGARAEAVDPLDSSQAYGHFSQWESETAITLVHWL